MSESDAARLAGLETEATARRENAADLWDRLWSKPESRDWRGVALARVYDRIVQLIPKASRADDFGGGVGALALRLLESREVLTRVIDHSEAALQRAAGADLGVIQLDLEAELTCQRFYFEAAKEDRWTLSTEVLEHLSVPARSRLLGLALHRWQSHKAGSFFTVPNNRLGPEEEPQHTIKWAAMEFLRLLRSYFGAACRVEVHGPYLLGICGPPALHKQTVSMCLPVKDEEADLEAVLASFRGFVDEIVVGIDPRSTDRTEEIARAYAEIVFELEDPTLRGDPGNPLHDPAVPETGVHFAWVRNQCIDHCSSGWIFMTEGHERLLAGGDLLLQLDSLIPEAIEVCYVTRRGYMQRWSYPWLHRNLPHLRYERSTHNVLVIPDSSPVAKVRPIETFHDRGHSNAEQRGKQRKTQNRKTLLDDWEIRGNPSSLFYFAQELRADNKASAAERFEEFLRESDAINGQMRYQARMILARLYSIDLAGEARKAWSEAKAKMDACDEEDKEQIDQDARAAVEEEKAAIENAVRTLHGCTEEDWSRTEHWLWLGDIASNAGQWEQAYQFYSYAGTQAGRIPFTVWWIDEPTYTYLPAQRLAITCGHLGLENEALVWAKRVVTLAPADAPAEFLAECHRNVELIEEVIGELAVAIT